MGVLTKISTKRLGKRIGAEVMVSAKSALFDDSTAREVLDALEAHSILVFRELHLDDRAQVAFSRKLGEVLILGSNRPEPGNPYPEDLQGHA